MRLGWRIHRVYSLKLVKLRKTEELRIRIKYARKFSFFYYVGVICTTTGGTEQIGPSAGP